MCVNLLWLHRGMHKSSFLHFCEWNTACGKCYLPKKAIFGTWMELAFRVRALIKLEMCETKHETHHRFLSQQRASLSSLQSERNLKYMLYAFQKSLAPVTKEHYRNLERLVSGCPHFFFAPYTFPQSSNKMIIQLGELGAHPCILLGFPWQAKSLTRQYVRRAARHWGSRSTNEARWACQK